MLNSSLHSLKSFSMKGLIFLASVDALHFGGQPVSLLVYHQSVITLHNWEKDVRNLTLYSCWSSHSITQYNTVEAGACVFISQT